MEPLTAYISRSALRANLAALRRQGGPGTAICAMVKANAYGHGVQIVAGELSRAGVEFLAVARLEEAEELRRLGLAEPILLIEPAVEPGGDSYLTDRLEAIGRVAGLRVTVADEAGAAALARVADRLARPIPVHLKIDTGMGRGGALPESAEPIARLVESSGRLELEGVYTHLATADEADDRMAREQLARFGALLAAWRDRGRRIRYVHAANSAGLARFAEPSLTLARPGLHLYGYSAGEAVWPAGAAPPLEPVLRLVARLAQVKDLPAGHPVGYGATWRAPRPSRVGLVPIGYADGYLRCLGNRAVMQVNGRDVPVVGRISMDLTTVDLSGLADGGRQVRAGAEVTVISERPEAANSVENLARLAQTIPYEITCLIGQRVGRRGVDSFDRGA